MSKAKKSSSKNKKSKSKLSELKNLLSKHKLLAVLIVILLLVIGTFTYGKFKDWENAQFIKGLARDFPALVEEIETATGLELEIITDCSITTEKFSSGVRTCEVSTGYIGINPGNVNEINNLVNSGPLSKKDNTNYLYKNTNACDMWYAAEDRFYLRCITAVREANIELARELFLYNK